jgi:hypothetical protein
MSHGVNWENRLDELKYRRVLLFESYKQQPRNQLLALQLKRVDDEIAECTERIRLEWSEDSTELLRQRPGFIAAAKSSKH